MTDAVTAARGAPGEYEPAGAPGGRPTAESHLDQVLGELHSRRTDWARLPIPAKIEFLERETQANLLVEDIQAFLQRWIPRFMLDQRASITVAIGCTGGRHRSIYIANQLAERFRSEYPVVLRHRDTQG